MSNAFEIVITKGSPNYVIISDHWLGQLDDLEEASGFYLDLDICFMARYLLKRGVHLSTEEERDAIARFLIANAP
ncbi:MAG: hypothetical protein JWO15_3595 [Sphingomonadales bacterium]|nr:hypothetical protein [Sphingomonadales bacterium]